MSDMALQAATPTRLRLSVERYRGLLTAILVFLALFGIVNLVSPRPYSFFDFSYMSTGGCTLALAAIGGTLVILTGGFDLSVGAVISLVNVALASHMQAGVGSEFGWALAGLGIGAAGGAFNGVFVAVLRMQPIVVTLATMFIVQGVTLLVMPQPGGQIPPDFASFLTGSAIPDVLPAAIVILAIALLAWTALAHSRFGTSIYAVGSDKDAAAAAGIKVVPAEFGAYVLAGMMYGAAGVFVSAQTGSGDPLGGDPLLLQVFAAIVIGGTVFGGGRGGCLGSVFGSYSLLLIINILLILNVSAYYSTVVEGAILVLAALGVSLDRHSPVAQWLRRVSHRTQHSGGGGSSGPTRPLVFLAQPMAPTIRLPWWRRHAEDLRYALPAYACFVLVLVGTFFLFGGLSGGYVNSLLLLGSFLAILCLGQGAVILTGGLDLSLPWTIGLCGILLAGVVRGHPFEAAWAVPMVLAIGALIGLLNGLGIVLFALPPIVMTLAMNGILQGVAMVYSNGTPSGFAPPELLWLMTAHVEGITPELFLLAPFVIVAALLLSKTPFGRRVYAIGNSVRAARLSGVDVGRTTVLVYVLSGFCSAIVGVLLDGFSGQASLGMGDSYLLPSIAVVVVGGTLITGGRGSYFGMIGGVLLLTALQTLLAGTTLPDAMRQIIYGLVVLCAVVVLRERKGV
ncbi:ABC transporter permease [Rhodopila globiformis]|uniref:ABC transporter permease n=1 Tax=Rhodopila globiformis TaxID=1071 RepID=A0A2S6NKV2_RHOGL|nr:ABC transporter permease [Rhodopila globiformis]PPQ35790.1 ABC transporter permease [Rhodopila globiformis]